MATTLKIAFIADIHGNLPALQAVFQDLPAIDLCVCVGDLVGYYPDVNEVCEFVRGSGVSTIRGNHDAYVVGDLEPAVDKVDAYRTYWTRDRLSSDNKKWLASLPIELIFRGGDYHIKVRHASPWDETTYLYPDSDRLKHIVLNPFEIWVFGHTHHPMQENCGQGLVMNPGAVGQPRDWNPKASYVLFDAASGRFEFRRVAYDIGGLQRRLKELVWNQAMIDTLSRVK